MYPYIYYKQVCLRKLRNIETVTEHVTMSLMKTPYVAGCRDTGKSGSFRVLVLCKGRKEIRASEIIWGTNQD